MTALIKSSDVIGYLSNQSFLFSAHHSQRPAIWTRGLRTSIDWFWPIADDEEEICVPSSD
jgi:hypothetical protein